MKLFVYSDLTPSQKSFLESHLLSNIHPTFVFDVEVENQQDHFLAADLLYGNPPSSWFSQGVPNLKFWQIDSAGFDQYQDLQIKAPVSNMGDFYAQACAETMVAGVLAFYRGIPTLVKLQQKSDWKGKVLRPSLEMLSGKKVIILGTGSIGTTIKKMLLGFNCQVLMTARQNPAADLFSVDEIYQHLPHTDIVINTLPGHLDKFVSEDFIHQLPTTCLYASVGRGNTTDEKALIQALQNGTLAGAVLDVTEQEPLPITSPLWGLQNVLLTQHTGGGQTFETEGKLHRLLNNLSYFLKGDIIPDQVNLAKGY